MLETSAPPFASGSATSAPDAWTRARIAAEEPKLRRYARSLTRDVTSADDLVQETMLRAISKSHKWQEGTDLRAWLFTIMHNQHVNQIRRDVRSPVSFYAADYEVLPAAARQDAGFVVRDLVRALARLPEEQRVVILLVGLEGMRCAL